MKIFYVDVEKFKKRHDRDYLAQYDDVGFKNEKRFFEYTIGRFLVKEVAESVYKAKNTKIILSETKKPVFEDNSLYFNISHSKNIVLACFDTSPCGVDVEFIKDRNLEKLSKYFNKNFKNSEDFYKFWTVKEAVYKLGQEPKDIHSLIFNDKYYLTAVSSFKTELEILEYDF